MTQGMAMKISRRCSGLNGEMVPNRKIEDALRLSMPRFRSFLYTQLSSKYAQPPPDSTSIALKAGFPKHLHTMTADPSRLATL